MAAELLSEGPSSINSSAFAAEESVLYIELVVVYKYCFILSGCDSLHLFFSNYLTKKPNISRLITGIYFHYIYINSLKLA